MKAVILLCLVFATSAVVFAKPLEDTTDSDFLKELDAALAEAQANGSSSTQQRVVDINLTSEEVDHDDHSVEHDHSLEHEHSLEHDDHDDNDDCSHEDGQHSEESVESDEHQSTQATQSVQEPNELPTLSPQSHQNQLPEGDKQDQLLQEKSKP